MSCRQFYLIVHCEHHMSPLLFCPSLLDHLSKSNATVSTWLPVDSGGLPPLRLKQRAALPLGQTSSPTSGDFDCSPKPGIIS